jgi:hypothetical protein
MGQGRGSLREEVLRTGQDWAAEAREAAGFQAYFDDKPVGFAGAVDAE